MFKWIPCLRLPSPADGNKGEVVKWCQFDLLNLPDPVGVSVDLGSPFRMVWEGWVAVSPKFHQAVTPVPSTLPAIVIPGLFQLSYGRNVPLHEKRSSLLMACRGSSPVLSQGCQDMDVLSHACSHPPIHQWGMLIFIMRRAFLDYLEEVSVLVFFFEALLTHVVWFLNKPMLQFIVHHKLITCFTSNQA